MNLGFVTCVQLGLRCMEAIYESGGKLKFALTLPDDVAINKSGRIYIDNFCQLHSIKLFKQSHINNSEVVNIIQEMNIDWLFIIGWSQLASSDVLKAPRKGVLGMHPTLLPIGRGRAAIPWAILKGLDETGVTLFKIDEGIDTGPIASQIRISLNDRISATELYKLVEDAHVLLIKEVIH